MASDHLPVLMTFHDPTPFRIVSLQITNQLLHVQWRAFSGDNYAIQASSNLIFWSLANPSITATGTTMSWSTGISGSRQFLRVLRLD